MITDGKMQKKKYYYQAKGCAALVFFGRNKQHMSYFKVTQKIIEQQVNHPQFIKNTHQV